MVLPEFLTKRNTNLRISGPSLSENKRHQKVSNDHSSSTKYILKDGANRRKSLIDMVKKKNKTEKLKGRKNSESSKTINRKFEPQISENLKSLMVMKIKQKNNASNNLDTIKKGKARNWSFEKLKNDKGENSQIGFRKTHYEKNQFKEIILLNTKNFKKKRKIKL